MEGNLLHEGPKGGGQTYMSRVGQFTPRVKSKMGSKGSIRELGLIYFGLWVIFDTPIGSNLPFPEPLCTECKG